MLQKGLSEMDMQVVVSVVMNRRHIILPVANRQHFVIIFRNHQPRIRILNVPVRGHAVRRHKHFHSSQLVIAAMDILSAPTQLGLAKAIIPTKLFLIAEGFTDHIRRFKQSHLDAAMALPLNQLNCHLISAHGLIKQDSPKFYLLPDLVLRDRIVNHDIHPGKNRIFIKFLSDNPGHMQIAFD